MRPSIEIDEAVSVNDEAVAAFARLMPQLSTRVPLPERDALEAIVRADCTTLLFARRTDTGQIVGTLTLVLYRVPTGGRAIIEDVVVDESSRGLGVGEALVQDALRRAAVSGANSVDLTSHASRAAANRLYLRLGFQLRDTNAYSYYFPVKTNQSSVTTHANS